MTLDDESLIAECRRLYVDGPRHEIDKTILAAAARASQSRNRSVFWFASAAALVLAAVMLLQQTKIESTGVGRRNSSAGINEGRAFAELSRAAATDPWQLSASRPGANELRTDLP